MGISKAILLVNLGTPEAPTFFGVARYLSEFLSDYRVINLPFLKRQFLVHGAIIPSRLKTSTKSYRAIWTLEGSPLMVYGKKTKALLQEKLGPNYHVELAMRYQTPTIAIGLEKLLEKQPDELVILPLFPQYASATTGSVFEAVSKELSKKIIYPKVTFINKFHSHPLFIQAFEEVSAPYQPLSYDHVLFSFHGLPQKQLLPESRLCYSAQCYQTAHALAKNLKLPSYTVCFQSRLGKDPWTHPFTSDVIEELGRKKTGRILVFCPSFVADCLETLYEIGVEYKELFIHSGGKELDLVPGLNTHPAWISALKAIVS